MSNGGQASVLRHVVALGAQAFALGSLVAWITIPANAIFLEAYGSGPLPWTYVAAAGAGALASIGLTAAFRNRAVVSVAMRVLIALAIALACSFVALRASGPWVSVLLLVLLPIVVPVGFMFIVGQAGTLLDVRALKALYGRVIGGFAIGFLTAATVTPMILAVVGQTDSLVALAAAVAAGLALIVWSTQRSFPELLVVHDDELHDEVRPNLRSLLNNRYVALIALFQMLSATESQWLDFLVYDRAAERYQSTDALAAFISRFTAIAYGADIVFLLLVAGWVLRRFGVRVGLLLNAVVVLVIVLATIAAGAALGSASTFVFLLVVGARVSDLTLADGTSRTSLGAAYQAVSVRERLAAQAAVEGLAVPLAIGVSGLILIIVQHTVGTDGPTLHVLTCVVLVAWIVNAVLLSRGYRRNLIANLRHRRLDPSELAVDDVSTLAAIDRLIGSDDEREIRLGVATLAVVRHPELQVRLEALAGDQRAGVRSYALDRLRELDPTAAARIARDGLGHPSAEIRAASVRALGPDPDPADVATLLALWRDPHVDVRLAAAAALGRLGDVECMRLLSSDVRELSGATDPQDRILAAGVLGCCGPTTGLDRDALPPLLSDPDVIVVQAALRAVRWPTDASTLDVVVAHLEDRRASAAAVEALATGGPVVLDVVDQRFSGALRLSRFGQQQLVKVCRIRGDDDTLSALLRWIGHDDREVGLAIAEALATWGSAPTDERVSDVIRGDLRDATHALRALSVLGGPPGSEMLARALGDLLSLLRRRIIACLAIRYGADNMSKVAFQLAQHDMRMHALAMEWIDVTLTGVDRAAAAILDPALVPHERLRLLEREFALPSLDAPEILRDLIDDPDRRWRRPWIAACALVIVAHDEGAAATRLALGSAMSGRELDGDESTIVGETIDGFRRRLPV